MSRNKFQRFGYTCSLSTPPSDCLNLHKFPFHIVPNQPNPAYAVTEFCICFLVLFYFWTWQESNWMRKGMHYQEFWNRALHVSRGIMSFSLSTAPLPSCDRGSCAPRVAEFETWIWDMHMRLTECVKKQRGPQRACLIKALWTQQPTRWGRAKTQLLNPVCQSWQLGAVPVTLERKRSTVSHKEFKQRSSHGTELRCEKMTRM